MQFRWARYFRAWNSCGNCGRSFRGRAIFVSTSTLAGSATAGEKLGALADGVFYAPVDYVFAVRRVLRTLRPSIVAIAETEIWPNLFRETKRIGAGLVLVNGRISDKAFPRYRRWGRFFAAAMPAVDAILAQSEEIRGRFLALGAKPERVRVAGNFKYDFEPRGDPRKLARAGTACRRSAGEGLDRRQYHASHGRRRRRRGRYRDRGVPRTGAAACRPDADSGAAQARTLRDNSRKARCRGHRVREAVGARPAIRMAFGHAYCCSIPSAN